MAEEMSTNRSGGSLVGPVEVITVATAEFSAPRATLLTESLFSVIEAVNASVSRGDARTIVDLQLPRTRGEGWWNTWAFVQAVRGIIQSVTLELWKDAPAINLVISEVDQQAPRKRTLAYLSSADGGFSRGATYDLRSKS